MDTDTSTALTGVESITHRGGSNKCVKPHPFAITHLVFPTVKKAHFFASCQTPQLIEIRKPAGGEQVNVLLGREQLWKWFHGSPPAAALQGELRNTNHAQTGLKTIQGGQAML